MRMLIRMKNKISFSEGEKITSKGTEKELDKTQVLSLNKAVS